MLYFNGVEGKNPERFEKTTIHALILGLSLYRTIYIDTHLKISIYYKIIFMSIECLKRKGVDVGSFCQ